jgi:hypothetical protein
VLTERLRYVFEESTLVQERFLADDPDGHLDLLDGFVRARRWTFDAALFASWRREVGDDGLVVAGELFSPLKMLHLAAGAANAVFLIEDHPDRCAGWTARSWASWRRRCSGRSAGARSSTGTS